MMACPPAREIKESGTKDIVSSNVSDPPPGTGLIATKKMMVRRRKIRVFGPCRNMSCLFIGE
jgi:hypothetical protein